VTGAGRRRSATGQARDGTGQARDGTGQARVAARHTRQRAAVSALLAQTDGFHSAQELHAMLRQRGERVGLSTVYRTLQGLAEAGEVDVMRPADGETRYRRCAAVHHHHHLVCRSCGRTVEVEGPAVEAWAERVAAAHGFTDVRHTLEIFGTCPDCPT